MEHLIKTVRGFDGALVLAPEPGGDFPEIAWGDAFFYYAPDGQVPQATQPYGTIVTKNYPGDELSDLDAPDRLRVNIQVDRAAFPALTGDSAPDSAPDYAAVDTVLPHPVYGAQSWICVVNPGERTSESVLRLLRTAHDAARSRYERRRQA
ncbi:DUF6194 family protein [Streptomyces sp. NPDC059897]|uniref:DUF6194 family protein n=1 Tax=Streptomyces sp. NPDC059897 TaxID=3346994 RepID=UPI003661675B